jgi:hypothetical protein
VLDRDHLHRAEAVEGLGKALRLSKGIKSGQVFVNNYGAGGGVELPFGGVRCRHRLLERHHGQALERPDPTTPRRHDRQTPCLIARGYDAAVNGLASYFVWLNRGKESLVADIKDPGDARIGVARAVAGDVHGDEPLVAGAQLVRAEPGAGRNGLASYFVWLNRGKESLVADIKDPGDARLLHAVAWPAP